MKRRGVSLLEVVIALGLTSLLFLFAVPALVNIFSIKSKSERTLEIERKLYTAANSLYLKGFGDDCLEEGCHTCDNGCCGAASSGVEYCVEVLESGRLKRVTVSSSNSNHKLVFIKGNWR